MLNLKQIRKLQTMHGRENNNRSAILNGKGSTADNFGCIVGGIGDLQGRANRCESVKSKHNLNID